MSSSRLHTPVLSSNVLLLAPLDHCCLLRLCTFTCVYVLLKFWEQASCHWCRNRQASISWEYSCSDIIRQTYPSPSWKQATDASTSSNTSSQTVPQTPLWYTSSRPSSVSLLPANRICSPERNKINIMFVHNYAKNNCIANFSQDFPLLS